MPCVPPRPPRSEAAVTRSPDSPSPPQLLSPDTPPAGVAGANLRWARERWRPALGGSCVRTPRWEQGGGRRRGRPPARCCGDAGPATRRPSGACNGSHPCGGPAWSEEPIAGRAAVRSRPWRALGAGAAPACGAVPAAGHHGDVENPQAARRPPSPGGAASAGLPQPGRPPLPLRLGARARGHSCLTSGDPKHREPSGEVHRSGVFRASRARAWR